MLMPLNKGDCASSCISTIYLHSNLNPSTCDIYNKIWNRLAQLAHSSKSSKYVLSHIIWFLTDFQVTSSYFCFIYRTPCFFVTRSSAFVISFSISALSVAHWHPFLLRFPWGFWLLNILLGSFLIDVVAMGTVSACKHNWPAYMYTKCFKFLLNYIGVCVFFK